jgi:Ca-activated chloride channel family protein
VPSNESFTVKIRYKRPDGESSQLIEQGVVDDGKDLAQASEDFRFAASVAGFGMLLRDSPHKGTLTYAGLLELAEPLVARDPHGYRREFTELVKKASSLSRP